jgi:hypothetical protein
MGARRHPDKAIVVIKQTFSPLLNALPRERRPDIPFPPRGKIRACPESDEGIGADA